MLEVRVWKECIEIVCEDHTGTHTFYTVKGGGFVITSHINSHKPELVISGKTLADALFTLLKEKTNV